jgi:hypothetical protein
MKMEAPCSSRMLVPMMWLHVVTKQKTIIWTNPDVNISNLIKDKNTSYISVTSTPLLGLKIYYIYLYSTCTFLWSVYF